MRIDELGEFPLIDRIVRQLGPGDDRIVLGAGDDTAAVYPTPGSLLLATCDSLVEDRHFVLGRIQPEQLGRRLAAVNLSDIAAMGGEPRWALASFLLPAASEVSFVEAVCRGLVEELARFGARVVGGNLTGGEQLALDLTLLGEVAPLAMLRRTGARPGDAILVTGDLGAAAAGRIALDRGLEGPEAAAVAVRQLTPEPRVAAGQRIAAAGSAHAMIDVSDGLAQDLGHLCDAGHVDLVVQASALPIASATRAVAAISGLDPLRLALAGGEDYELICCVAPEAAAQLISMVQHSAGVRLTRIGTVLASGESRWLEHPDGRREQLRPEGWQHFAEAAREE